LTESEYQRLVEFLSRQFEAIDRRFDGVDRRFDANDRRFEAIDQRFDELRGEILGHFDEIYRRLERLEQEYQAITQTLRRIEALLADERARREILERDLATLRENVAVLNARIEDIERRLRSG
jgi:chromosome segregation ATPase